MKYNKLVRDKIPEIIRANGDIAITRIADDTEYKERLYEKLQEEIAELIHTDTPAEELADILEVIYAIGDLHNLSRDELESTRLKKTQDRGAFKNKIILVETKD